LDKASASKLLGTVALSALLLGWSGTKTIRDGDSYSAGPYMAYMAPFNKAALKQGEDFDDDITVSIGDFPNKSEFTWNWPSIPCPSGVYNFNAIDFGDYYNTAVATPIPSRPINRIRELTETHKIELSGEPSNFDVMDNFFLSSAPNNHSAHIAEIEVFLHTPDYTAAFVRQATPVGVFHGSDRTWLVTKATSTSANIPDILFMPADQKDVLNATIDIAAMLNWLRQKAELPDTAYFNGMAIGVEVRQGVGQMNLQSYSVSYK
jgi:hypothetical protein